ncbi:hypothetical protein Bhyg_09858 [Pseudolycoriella hygida]|uniref:Uncharacterized protein n=1 Tax=Pseudolycoriella hygida TaxID=35572 RepID=A0A9Q0MSB7_9DIPT|nr:hypothetical protein Bhyg_09858 [Pseudolycoriella hygida]
MYKLLASIVAIVPDYAATNSSANCVIY